jgi:hypothetical protein
VWWEYLGAFLSGVGSVIGAAFAIRAVVRHEQEACDARLDAFKEGLHEEGRK